MTQPSQQSGTNEIKRMMISSTALDLPVLPPFDESRFEPMPEVEIDPAYESVDEFESIPCDKNGLSSMVYFS